MKKYVIKLFFIFLICFIFGACGIEKENGLTKIEDDCDWGNGFKINSVKKVTDWYVCDYNYQLPSRRVEGEPIDGILLRLGESGYEGVDVYR